MAQLLVSCEWLRNKIDNHENQLRVLDCTYAAGADYVGEYVKSHIPGARHFDIEKASYKKDPVIRELYKPDEFQNYVRSLGVDKSSHVVLYDQNVPLCGFFGTPRAWWLFKLYGFENVSILNGGFKKWTSLGYPVSNEISEMKEGDFQAVWNPKYLATFDEFVRGVESVAMTTIDARPEKQYNGEDRKAPGVTGSFIPTTINIPATEFVKDGLAKTKEDILEIFRHRNVDLCKPLITFCNSGMQSSVVYFFCNLASIENVKNYNGALSEVINRKPEMVCGVPKEK